MENANGVKPFRPDLFLETAEEKELEVSASPYMSFWTALTDYQQLGGPNNRNLLPNGSGGQRSEISCQQGHTSSRSSRGESIPCFFWELLGATDIPGMWPQHSYVCLHGYNLVSSLV